MYNKIEFFSSSCSDHALGLLLESIEWMSTENSRRPKLVPFYYTFRLLLVNQWLGPCGSGMMVVHIKEYIKLCSLVLCCATALSIVCCFELLNAFLISRSNMQHLVKIHILNVVNVEKDIMY